MDVELFCKILGKHNIGSFFTGVPDSQLSALCNYLYDSFGISKKHIIAANEGNCIALGAGYYLSTGKIPAIYMQNSGIGNALNPLASLSHEDVYGIPNLLIIGWRGEPGVHDEPQHVHQGKITLKLLEDLEIPYFILDDATNEHELDSFLTNADLQFTTGKSVAIVVRKKGLQYDVKTDYSNGCELTREQAIEKIIEFTGTDIIISTTGKASRELFELREKRNNDHTHDFLTVGSMGHCSSIAMGIALNKPDKKVWCIDGDGAMLMHMGALAVIGNVSPQNMIHIVLNNNSHESVGGMPTVSNTVNICEVAQACGYKATYQSDTLQSLEDNLAKITKSKGPILLEIKCANTSRSNLGRPTTTTWENKKSFMKFLEEGC